MLPCFLGRETRLWQALERHAARGAEVVILTGNHDSALAGMSRDIPFRTGDLLQWLRILPKVQRETWCDYWKLKIHRARSHIHAFERCMVELALRYGCDGVVCGHIHRPDVKQLHHGWYFNCGDWVEHRSCVLETYDGAMRLVNDLMSPQFPSEAA